MGRIIIQEHTTKAPITLIGAEAGICYGANTANAEKNYARGMDCLLSGHGRTFEFPDVYLVFDGYSARVIRELYTHIGGAPTRLQASTRYINYQKGFGFVTPPSIANNPEAAEVYGKTMDAISNGLKEMEALGVPREDSAMALPMAMTTKVVGKYNLRTLIDMSHQRMCTRAYHEYRAMFGDLCEALRNYSDEWKFLVDNLFMPKCKVVGYCNEKKSCGLMPRKEAK